MTEASKRFACRRRGDDGQATVELVFVLPVLAIIALAVVQVALVGRDQLLVWHAAREAGRQASVEPHVAVVEQAALASSSALAADRLDVQVTGGTTSGDLVAVNVTYRAATDVPIVGLFIDDRILSADVVFRVE